jgi:hypothetical protein
MMDGANNQTTPCDLTRFSNVYRVTKQGESSTVVRTAIDTPAQTSKTPQYD